MLTRRWDAVELVEEPRRVPFDPAERFETLRVRPHPRASNLDPFGPPAFGEEVATAVARPALAATRALDIVSFLTEHPNDAFTMAQLTRALRLNQGSAHAVLTTMTEQGFLTRHPEHRTFRLGPALVAVGEAATRANPIIAVAREELQALSDDLALPALASMRTGSELRVVVRVGPHVANGPARRVGQHYPLVPPIGTVLTAWSPPRPKRPGSRRRHQASTVTTWWPSWPRSGPRATTWASGLWPAMSWPRQPGSCPMTPSTRIAWRGSATGPVWSSGRPDDDVAVVAAPVLDASDRAVLECSVYGFGAPPSAATLDRVAAATRSACTVIARRANQADAMMVADKKGNGYMVGN